MCDHDIDCRDGSDESPECGKHVFESSVFIVGHTHHDTNEVIMHVKMLSSLS